MPELPDVETFRHTLQQHGLQRGIRDVTLRAPPRMLEEVTESRLRKALVGHKLTATTRHGKHLFARIGQGDWLMLHFGMTGYLASGRGAEADPKHDVLVLQFEDGSHVAFNCRRKFGAIAVTPSPKAYAEKKGLGPDALTLNETEFLALLDGRSGTLKGLLMNQVVIAGVGNVYSDEILFQAGLHPLLPLNRLDAAGRRRLFRALHSVLTTAIEADAQPARLPANYLLPSRGRRNARCPGCDEPPQRLVVGGRSAYFCPCRQPPP